MYSFSLFRGANLMSRGAFAMYLPAKIRASQYLIDGNGTLLNSPEGTLDGVQVVSSNSYQLSTATQVLMQLVLQVDERVVCCLGHGLGETEDGRSKVGSNRRHLCQRRNIRRGQCIVRRGDDPQCHHVRSPRRCIQPCWRGY